MRTREEIVNHIEKLKIKPVENVHLIKKWERLLRSFDKMKNSDT